MQFNQFEDLQLKYLKMKLSKPQNRPEQSFKNFGVVDTARTEQMGPRGGVSSGGRVWMRPDPRNGKTSINGSQLMCVYSIRQTFPLKINSNEK